MKSKRELAKNRKIVAAQISNAELPWYVKYISLHVVSR